MTSPERKPQSNESLFDDKRHDSLVKKIEYDAEVEARDERGLIDEIVRENEE